MLIVIGGGAVFIARNYPFGTVAAHGPRLLPDRARRRAGRCSALYFVVQGLRSSARSIEGGWSLRALIVLPLSLVLFGLLMDRAGFVPALLVLIFGSAAGEHASSS